MVIYFAGMTAPYIVAMDIEHDHGVLLQFAGILFKNVGDSLYATAGSTNFYVRQNKVSNFTMRYTHITPKFLELNGMTLEEAQIEFESFMKGIDPSTIIFCSHGVHQDAMIMKSAGLDISSSPHLCTYQLAKTVLKRDKHLKLSDVLYDAGLCTVMEHNA